MVDDKKGKETLKLMVGTTHRSIATMASAWLRKSQPALRRWSSASTRYWETVDFATSQAKLEQFAVDTRCAPERVVAGSSAGSGPAVAVDFRPARPTARSPPIGPKPCSMPSRDGVGLHHAGQSYQAGQSQVSQAIRARSHCPEQAMRCPPSAILS